MNRIFIFVFFLLGTLQAAAQQEASKVLGSFIFGNKSYTYSFVKESEQSFTLGISSIMVRTKVVPVKAPKTSDTTEPEAEEPDVDTMNVSIFSSFTQEVFAGIFAEQMHKYIRDDSSSIRDKATEVFGSIRTRLEFMDDEPSTAYLVLRKDSIASFLYSNADSLYQGKLSRPIAMSYIESVTVETEDGTIKNVIALLRKPGATPTPRQHLVFKNQYPISISAKFDPERFARVPLYCLDCNGVKGLSRYLNLSELLMLDIVLANDKEDYSPANKVITLTPSTPVQELKKEKRSQIIDISAFTDFVGLNEEQPNGLIQIEAKRKINLNTQYYPFRKNAVPDAVSNYNSKTWHLIGREKNTKRGGEDIVYRVDKDSSSFIGGRDSAQHIVKYFIPNKSSKQNYYNWVGSVEPRLLFSKLESNNRLIDSAAVPSSGAMNPLLLYKYQLASFGLNLNVLKIYYAKSKLTWNVLSVGTYWYRSRVRNSRVDSTAAASTILNSGYLAFNTQLRLKPDGRWGVSGGISYILQDVWNTQYHIANQNGLFQYEFDGHLKTSETSKLFFRFRWIYEHQNRENNFTQIQMGYTLNIFSAPADQHR